MEINKETLKLRVKKAFHGTSFNTNEKADDIRSVLKDALEVDDFPVLHGWEDTWQLLESSFRIIDREKHPSASPLETFNFYASMGFYPPPEIMITICKCIQKYEDGGGKLSLDEVFFGQKHKNKSSLAFIKDKRTKYSAFHNVWVSMPYGKRSKELSSLEKLAENYLPYINGDEWEEKEDVDSFLRGYRRWLKQSKK